MIINIATHSVVFDHAQISHVPSYYFSILPRVESDPVGKYRSISYRNFGDLTIVGSRILHPHIVYVRFPRATRFDTPFLCIGVPVSPVFTPSHLSGFLVQPRPHFPFSISQATVIFSSESPTQNTHTFLMNPPTISVSLSFFSIHSSLATSDSLSFTIEPNKVNVTSNIASLD